MSRRRMDDGRHGPRHEVDWVASVAVGETRTTLVCQCGVPTADMAGHLAHAADVLHVPGPAWIPVGARLAAMLVGGVALCLGLIAGAHAVLTGTAQTVALGLSPVVSFGATMGAAHVLRGYVVPLAPATRK
ncbi:hypothetical protein [Kitasatospora sp. LaBMicrA B282]|uniref:hypothetical protein n=1 Tax=Kitasatospora sp. LaBMicrA B282 TaxID=3420949 RepID=UPI003D0E0A5E